MLRIVQFVVSLFRTATTPSPEFLASFATPPVSEGYFARRMQEPEFAAEYVSERARIDAIDVAQDVSHLLHEAVRPIIAQIDAALAMAQEWSQSLPAPMYVPTGAEFDEAERIAATVTTDTPAKQPRVRVYSLAADCAVDSKFMRGVLDQHFGIATKSPSSTVTQAQANEVREFFLTHTDV